MNKLSMRIRRSAAVLLACSMLGLSSSALVAQTAETHFEKKQISFVVGFNPGGSYDTYARLVAQHLAKHIPGAPTIVLRNMQGANGARAASYLTDQAARDGTVIGMLSQAIAVKKVLEDPAHLRIDVAKLTWLGRITSAVEATIVWHGSPTQTIEDARNRETILAATGELGTPDTNPRLMNAFAGTKFKIVTGYPGAAATMLAMERGEVEGSYTGLANLLATRGDWLRQGMITVLVQYSQQRHRAFPDVPAMGEFGRTPEERQILGLYASAADIGIAIAAPPDLPSETLAVLRRAFDAMVGDPAFLADARSRQMEIEPMTGEALQPLIAGVLATSPDLVKRAAAAREVH
jgi:tripartite-type tricarboxylate transporter receptor subunit TctC